MYRPVLQSPSAASTSCSHASIRFAISISPSRVSSGTRASCPRYVVVPSGDGDGRGLAIFWSPTGQEAPEATASDTISTPRRWHRVCYGVPSTSEGGVMAEGTIKRLTDKGFGFIETSPGKDIFFHMSAVQGVRFEDLKQGQRVSFTEGMGPKGPRAENVKPI